MAQMPPNAMPAAAPAPAGAGAAPPMDDAADDAGEGYCIEISVLPNGTFNVSKEALKDEADEDNAAAAGGPLGVTQNPNGPGAPPAEAHGQDFDSAADAFKAALEIYRANPVGQGEQAGLDAGFQQG